MLPEGVNVVRVVAVSGAGSPVSRGGADAHPGRRDAPRHRAGGRRRAVGSNDPVQVVATATDPHLGDDADRAQRTLHGDRRRRRRAARRARQLRRADGDAARESTASTPTLATPPGTCDGARPRTIGVAIDETPPRVELRPPPRSGGTGADRGRRQRLALRGRPGSRVDRGPSSGLAPTLAAAADEVTAGRLVARWDSDSYPPGIYEFRATAYDAAGNAAASEPARRTTPGWSWSTR